MTEKSPMHALSEKYEHWETDRWAPKALLTKELMTERVIDPCCGTGIMTLMAREAGYSVIPFDIFNWGFEGTILQDWLNLDPEFIECVKDSTVFMNPPFSISEKFVEKCFEYGARKIICFQKFSWYEGAFNTGKKRGKFWDKYRPARIWVCGDRASCWRHDIALEDRTSSTPTAYAFFVFERGHMPAALCGHIFKGDAT